MTERLTVGDIKALTKDLPDDTPIYVNHSSRYILSYHLTAEIDNDEELAIVVEDH